MFWFQEGKSLQSGIRSVFVRNLATMNTIEGYTALWGIWPCSKSNPLSAFSVDLKIYFFYFDKDVQDQLLDNIILKIDKIKRLCQLNKLLLSSQIFFDKILSFWWYKILKIIKQYMDLFDSLMSQNVPFQQEKLFSESTTEVLNKNQYNFKRIESHLSRNPFGCDLYEDIFSSYHIFIELCNSFDGLSNEEYMKLLC